MYIKWSRAADAIALARTCLTGLRSMSRSMMVFENKYRSTNTHACYEMLPNYDRTRISQFNIAHMSCPLLIPRASRIMCDAFYPTKLTD